jgi:hypothetical protein
MKTSVNYYDFVRAFEQADRAGQFTRAGLCALYNYLGEYEEDCGCEIELDVIALCCDYSEHESLQEWAHEYFSNAWEELGFDCQDCDDDAFDDAIREFINDNGQLIEFDSGIIVSSF